MRQIKVLHYAPGFLSGGIESRLLDWYRNIDRNKIKFYLIKLNDNDDTDNIREFKKLGGEVYNLPALNAKNAVDYFIHLNKIIKNGNFDVIHAHSISSSLFPLGFGKVYGIEKRIMHSRTTKFMLRERNIFIKKMLKKMLTFFSTDYFACSEEAGVWAFGERKKEQIKVIKNGIEVERFVYNAKVAEQIKRELNIPKEKKIIGSLSRLSPAKNMNFLIDIFSEIHKKDEHTILLIVGDGPIMRELADQVEKLLLSNSVIFVGEKSNIQDYYMAFDLFLATSFYEGFGTTAIEAQAAGIPTVLSTGFPEIVAVTNLVKRIDLNESKDIWTKKIIANLYKPRNLESVDEIIASGYSAFKTAEDLEKKYLQ